MLALVLSLAPSLAMFPPLPPFPSELRPRDASTAPQNTALFALGDPAPPVGDTGFAVLVDGTPASLGPASAIGCCVITVPFTTPPPVGSTVSVTVTSASGEGSATFTVSAADTQAPTLTEPPSLIASSVKGSGFELVIGVKATDDTQIGMITALDGDTVVGATVDGYVLKAELTTAPAPGAQACVDVVVTDVAGNAAPRAAVCATVPGGEGEGEGEGEGASPPGGCAQSAPSSTSSLCVLGLALLARRRRR